MGSAMAVVLMLLVIVGTSSVVNADCSQDTISGLTPCDAAVMKGGSGTPSEDCCKTLRSWGIDCLCSVLSQYGNGGNWPSFVEPSAVIALPKNCGLYVKSGYTCDGYTFP